MDKVQKPSISECVILFDVDLMVASVIQSRRRQMID
jgi:hypothetical protein